MIWYHGTTKESANIIRKCNYFKEGTWFARHLEDAVEFGGSYIFAIEIRFKTHKWQVCCSNKISTDKIIKTYWVREEKA